MFRISPSKKDTIQPPATTVAAAPIDPVTRWMNDYNFAFPPTLTTEDVFHHQDARFKEIRELPKVGYPLYHLISQYNPWLDCEMTREKRAFLAPRVGEFCCPVYVGGGGGTDHLSRNVPSSIFRNETVIDIVNLYLWPLLHSRADDVIACRTFAEWQRLFAQTIILAFPDYEYWKSVAAGAGAGADCGIHSDLRPTPNRTDTEIYDTCSCSLSPYYSRRVMAVWTVVVIIIIITTTNNRALYFY